MSGQVLVLVGTDHHPFTRLVRWADEWAIGQHDRPILVQHGYSPPPEVASGIEFMSPQQLRVEVSKALVVITHGGPGTLMDARVCGLRPILVPRDPCWGEHVDDHQVRFSRWVEQKDLATVVSDTAHLHDVVHRELATPSAAMTPSENGSKAAETLTKLLAANRSRIARRPFRRESRRLRRIL